MKKTNKAAKRALSLLLALFFVISAFPDISGLITTAASADPLALEQIKVGEYFLMGKYYEKPILWRNINNDENNNPLMFSDKIIAIKVADAMTTKKTESHERDTGNERANNGSNYWDDSNIRIWLQSKDEAGSVKWGDNPPVADKLPGQYNPYDQEAGFLTNFTEREKTAIKEVEHDSLLANMDSGLHTDGSTLHSMNNKIATVITNYESAYRKKVTDTMFLLGVDELSKYVYNNQQLSDRTTYYMAYPTAEAVKNSKYKNGNLSADKVWYYWLRSPGTANNYNFRCVAPPGNVYYNYAYSNYNYFNYGVRPAFYLKNESFKDEIYGKGTKIRPYAIEKLDAYGENAPTNQVPPAAAEGLQESDEEMELIDEKDAVAYLKSLDYAKNLDVSGSTETANIGDPAHDGVVLEYKLAGGSAEPSATTDPETTPDTSDGWSAVIPKAKHAGTYRVHWRLKGNSLYNDYEGGTITVKILSYDSMEDSPGWKLPVPNTQEDGSPLEYKGSTAEYAQELLKPGKVPSGAIPQYRTDRDVDPDPNVDTTKWSENIPKATEAGVYNVHYRVLPGSSSYKQFGGDEMTITSEIKKCQMSEVTPPKAIEGLVENGTEQELVTPGVVNDKHGAAVGHLVYWLSESGTDSGKNAGPQSETPPKAKDVGTYYVWYAAETNDSNHESWTQSQYKCVTVTIRARQSADITPPKPKEELTYNKNAQELVTAGSIDPPDAGLKMEYSLDETHWSEDIPKATDADEYTVYWRVVSSKDYNGGSDSVQVTIKKAAPTVDPEPKAKEGLTYTGNPQVLITAGKTDGGEIRYALGTDDDALYTPYLASIVGVTPGTYTVYWKVFGDKNYEDYTPDPNSITVTIGGTVGPVVTPAPAEPTTDPNATMPPEATLPPPATPTPLAKDVEVGQYFLAGNYYRKPILWRNINNDDEGNPLLFSDKIICLKAFDAATSDATQGSHRRDYNNQRKQRGSNYWEDSNIRKWLQSNEKSIEWDGNPPTANRLYDGNWNDGLSDKGYNAYNQEAGFLTNFTEQDRSAIKMVEHDSLLSEVDKDLKTAGINAHQPDEAIDQVITNYDYAYKQKVNDTIFLLDVKEIHDVYSKGAVLGSDYYIGEPTAEAVKNSQYQDEALAVGKKWYFSLRSPSANYAHMIRAIINDGEVNETSSAAAGHIGIRPAFYLDKAKANDPGVYGNGTKTRPYSLHLLDAYGDTAPEEQKPPKAIADALETGFPIELVDHADADNYLTHLDYARNLDESGAETNEIGGNDGVRLEYKLESALVDPSESVWSTAVPTARYAGTYTVKWRLIGNSLYNNYEGGSFKVKILSADSMTEAPGWALPKSNDLTYNGAAQELLTAGVVPDGAIPQYRLDRGDYIEWSPTIPKMTDAGVYNVHYRVLHGTSSYQDFGGDEMTITVEIKKCPMQGVVHPTKNTLTYNGHEQELVTPGKVNDPHGAAVGHLLYWLADENGDNAGPQSLTPPKMKDAGTYYVWYSAETMDSNHASWTKDQYQYVTVTIKKATPVAYVVGSHLTYNGEEQQLLKRAETSVDGVKLLFKVGDGVYSASMPTAKEPGTYTVYYKAEATSNYEEIKENSVTATIGKNSVNVAVGDAEITYGDTLTLTAKVGRAAAFASLAANADEVEFSVNGKSLGTAAVSYDGTFNDSGTAKLTLTAAQYKGKLEPGVNIVSAVYGGSVYLNGGEDSIINVRVDKKELTYTVTAKDKPYADTSLDRPNPSNIVKAALTPQGVVDGDSVTLYAVAKTASADVDTYNTVTLENVRVTDDGDGRYYTVADSYRENVALTAPVKITPVSPQKWVTAPHERTLTYSGTPHELITVGSAPEGCVFEYSTDGAAYSSEIPMGSDVKEYTVYWKVTANTNSRGNKNYTDYTPEPNTVTSHINNKKTPSVTPPKPIDGLEYNKTAQALVTAGSVDPAELKMEYSLGNGVWSEDIPKATDAGSHTVWYRVTGNDEYNGVSGSVTAEINKKKPTVTAPTAIEGLKYTGNPQILINPGTTDGGEMRYSLNSNIDALYTPYLASIVGTTAGEYTVYWKVVGDNNYEDYIPVPNSISVTIGEADPTPTPSQSASTPAPSKDSITTAPEWRAPAAKDLTYNDEAQELITPGEVPDGATIEYRLDRGSYTSWSSEIPKMTDAGTYVVHYRAVGGTSGYADYEGMVMTEIKKCQISGVDDPTANTLTYSGHEQELVTAGKVNDKHGAAVGHLLYWLADENGDNAGPQSLTPPRAADVGTYYVWYTVETMDPNHASWTKSQYKCVTVTIDMVKPKVTIEAAEDLKYTGFEQMLLAKVEADIDGVKILFKTDGGEYSENIPTAKEVGSYTVYYKVEATENYAAVAEQSITVEISKADSDIAANGTAITYGDTLTLTAEVGRAPMILAALTANVDKVAFYVNGDTLLGEADVVYGDGVSRDRGAATLTLTAAQYKGKLEPGISSISAVYGGSVNLNGSDDSVINIRLNKKPLTYTVTAEDKPYADVSLDRPDPSNIVEATLTPDGVLDGDSVTLYAVAKTESADVDEYETVSLENIRVTDEGDGRYYTVAESYRESVELTTPVSITAVSPEKWVTAPIGRGLTYDGSTHELITAGSAPERCVFEYSTDGDSYSRDIPTGLETKEYTIYWKVVANENPRGNKNYIDYIPEPNTVSAEINNKQTPKVIPPGAIPHLIYSGSEQELVTAGSVDPDSLKMEYSLGNGIWSKDIPKAANAGSYTVWYRVTGDGEYNGVSGSVSAEIKKANPDVTPPTAIEGLTYTGNPQVLIEAGTTSGGEMRYSLGSNIDTFYTPYLASIVGTMPGEYTVYWKVAGDNNYENYTPEDNEITVTIGGVVGSITTAPEWRAPAAKELEYTGEAQELINAGTVPEGAEIEYRLDRGGYTEWSKSIPKMTEAGTYLVHYLAKGGSTGYTDYEGTVVVEIKKCPITDVNVPTANTLTYNGHEQELITPGKVNDTRTIGRLLYWLSDSPTDSNLNAKQQSLTPAKAVNAGTYYVWYTVESADANHESWTKAQCVTVTVGKANPNATVEAADNLKYNGFDQQLLKRAETDVDGVKLLFKVNDGEYSAGIPTGKEAGTYAVYYKAEGTNNYEAIEEQSITAEIDKNDSAINVGDVEITYGNSLTFTAKVSRASSSANEKVAFYAKNDVLLGEADIANGGTATLTLTAAQYKGKLEPGLNNVTAVYNGNVNLNGGEDSIINVRLNKKPVTYTVTAEDKPYADVNQPRPNPSNIVIATLTPTGVVEGDSVTLYAIAKTASADVDTYETVSLDNIRVTNEGDGRYYTVAESYRDRVALTAPVSITAVSPGKWVTAPMGRELTYNGALNELITAGSAPDDCVFEYSLVGNVYSRDIPEGSKIKEYTVYWKVTASENSRGNKNYTDYTPEANTVTAKINNKKAPAVIQPKPIIDITYNTEAQELVTAGSVEPDLLKMEYSLGNGVWSEAIPKATDAGNYTVWYRVEGNDEYNSESGYVSAEIKKAKPTVTPPTAKEGLIYIGNPQVLIEAGTTNGGEMHYALGSNSNALYTPYLASIVGTAPGEYTVYWKVAGDNNYEDYIPEPDSITARIEEAEPTPTPTPTPTTSPTLKPTPSPTLTPTSTPSKGSITTAPEWQEPIPNTKDDGTLLEYTGEAQTLVQAGTVPEGAEIEYRLDRSGYTEWSSEIPKMTDAGTYTVYYRAKGGTSGYADYEGSVVTEIKKAKPEVTPPTAIEGLRYTGNPQILINPGTTNGGEMRYALGSNSDALYTPYLASVVGTIPGEYTVYWKVVGDNNYENYISETDSITAQIGEPWDTPPSPPSKGSITTAPEWCEPTANTKTDGTPLEYTGEPQELVQAGTVPKGAEIEYRLDGGGYTEWLKEIPKMIDAGTYTVYYRAKGGTSGYTDYEGTVTMEIKKAKPEVTPPTAIEGLKYTGNPQILINPGKTTGGEIHYALGSSIDEMYAPYLASIVGINSGEYKVYWKVVGNNNYEDYTPEPNGITVTIASSTGSSAHGSGSGSGGGGGGSSTTSVKVEKYWIDNSNSAAARPDSITVHIKNGDKTVATHTLNKANKWTYTFSRLTAKEKGNEITYTVEEESVDGYEANYIKTGTGYIIENKYVGETDTNNNTPAPGLGTEKIPALNNKDHYAYVVGYPDGNVRPEAEITRAEIAAIFFRLLTDATVDKYLSNANQYNDVPASAWYNDAVSTLTAAGIVSGYPDGSFAPDSSVTRAELASMTVRFDIGVYEGEDIFDDIRDHWAKEYINYAASRYWVNGYGDGTFGPDRAITRAEAITLINNLLNRIPENKSALLEDMTVWKDNTDPTAWYYLAIQEATNSHYYDRAEDGAKEIWKAIRNPLD